MSGPEILVLPGLGSPESPLYRDVYSLLEDEARRRKMPMRCLKYGGQGHLAGGVIEGQITLPGVARAIEKEVRAAPPGSVMVCRSFGCHLPGYLAFHHGVELAAFSRIALWGPVPFFNMWRMFGTQSRLEAKMAEAKGKGARLAPDFYNTMIPLEICCRPLIDTEVVVAVGTLDSLTCEEFARLIQAVLRKTDPARANVIVRRVEGAPHEVTLAQTAKVRTDYLNALFG